MIYNRLNSYIAGQRSEFGYVEHAPGVDAMLFTQQRRAERPCWHFATAKSTEHVGSGGWAVWSHRILFARECNAQCATGSGVDDVAIHRSRSF